MKSQRIFYYKEYLNYLTREIDFLDKLLTDPMNGRLTFSSSGSAKETAEIFQEIRIAHKERINCSLQLENLRRQRKD
jgi:hypothetical protein